MRVLIVEDDRKIASFLTNGLRQAGFVVSHAADGLEGFNLASAEMHDVAIVDLMLPKMDGITLIEELRRLKINLPVLILSAKRSVDDRIKGLQTGGDDYLVKPFAFSELLARLHALIRRSTGASEPTHLHVADLSIDLLKREVTRAGQSLVLQPREYALLEYLARNAGRVVSKTTIMEQVWGYHFDPETNVVEARISRLRDKVDKGHAQSLIFTVRGVGYVLKDGA